MNHYTSQIIHLRTAGCLVFLPCRYPMCRVWLHVQHPRELVMVFIALGPQWLWFRAYLKVVVEFDGTISLPVVVESLEVDYHHWRQRLETHPLQRITLDNDSENTMSYRLHLHVHRLNGEERTSLFSGSCSSVLSALDFQTLCLSLTPDRSLSLSVLSSYLWASIRQIYHPHLLLHQLYHPHLLVYDLHVYLLLHQLTTLLTFSWHFSQRYAFSPSSISPLTCSFKLSCSDRDLTGSETERNDSSRSYVCSQSRQIFWSKYDPPKTSWNT